MSNTWKKYRRVVFHYFLINTTKYHCQSQNTNSHRTKLLGIIYRLIYHFIVNITTSYHNVRILCFALILTIYFALDSYIRYWTTLFTGYTSREQYSSYLVLSCRWVRSKDTQAIDMPPISATGQFLIVKSMCGQTSWMSKSLELR